MLSQKKKKLVAKDFPLKTTFSNLSKIILSSRYPTAGYALNTKVEMTVFILSGKVSLTVQNKKKILIKNSAVLIKSNQKYFWQPQKKVTLLIFSTPPWTPKQQKVLK